MKLQTIFFASCFAIGSAHATVTLNTNFGVATTSDGTPVPDGTLWIMVVDNGNNSLPGGLTVGKSLVNDDIPAIDDVFFTGSTISLGTVISSDTVFAIGGFSGGSSFAQDGFDQQEIILTLGINGVATNRIFGFYWFPGVEFIPSGTELPALFEVGGISESSMVIPADGVTVAIAAETEEVGGSFDASRFTAVAIPEPTTLTLTALAALGLLRRRRA